MEQKLLSGIPFFEKNGIWRSNFSFVGDSSLFHTLKIRKCVTLIIIFLSIDPIYRICENRSFTYLFSNQQEEGGHFFRKNKFATAP